MYNTITQFLSNKEFNDELKSELYSHYIKYREEKRNTEEGTEEGTEDSNEGDNELFLLFNRKNETDLQNECNGLIFEKKTNKLVCAAYPDFNDQIITNNDYKLTSVEYCEDGTVVRLYNYNNMWYTSTKRCINAVNSHWSSTKTFDSMFWELFNDNLNNFNTLDTLDKNKTYIFILHHMENILVVKHNQNKLVYTGSIDNTTHEIDDTFIFENHHNIIPTLKINMNLIDIKNNNFESLFNPTKRGLIFKYKFNDNYKFYKYDFNEYKHIKNIRGNVPYIRTRYLELLSTPELLNELVRYYPEYNMTFSMIEHCRPFRDSMVARP